MLVEIDYVHDRKGLGLWNGGSLKNAADNSTHRGTFFLCQRGKAFLLLAGSLQGIPFADVATDAFLQPCDPRG
jgi:hypothetical protein